MKKKWKLSLVLPLNKERIQFIIQMSPFSASGSNSRCVLTLTKSKHEHDSKLNGYTEKAKYLRNTRSLINNLFKK